mgnify:CR=1 FL=1
MNATNSENARARSSVYGLLAVGFAYPEREFFNDVASGRLADDLTAALTLCAVPSTAETVAGLRSSLPFEDFEAAYLRAFETNAPTPSVSLYQASYVPGLAKSDLLLELKAFYSNFDLMVAPGLHELEDKLTAELECMHFLAAKQAQTGDDASLHPEPYVLAQNDFLKRHLATWLPRFSEAVEAQEVAPFFLALARSAATFVVSDSKVMEQAARQLAA